MSNSTLSRDFGKAWTFFPIIETFILGFALIFNGGLIILFIFCRHLQTPFSVYLVNLLLMTFIYVAAQGPLNIINTLYFEWWLGDRVCTFLFYTIYTSSAAIVHAHLLITINRLWAITNPVSYRKHHSGKLAIGLCFTMLLYCHTLPLYGVVADDLYYKIPASTGICTINMPAQQAWGTAAELIFFAFPLIFMVGCNGYLLYRRKKRFLSRVNTTSTRAATSMQTENTTSTPLDLKKPSKEPKRALVLLVCLTVSVVVCWTPGISYFTIALLFSVDLPMIWLRVGAMLFSAQSVVDPVVLALSFKDVKDTIKHYGRRLRKCTS